MGLTIYYSLEDSNVNEFTARHSVLRLGTEHSCHESHLISGSNRSFKYSYEEPELGIEALLYNTLEE